MNKQLICNNLKYNLSIEIRDTVTSTNSILKEAASKGEKEGTVLIASHQSDGKGRMGRQFYSPANSGIYLSIILRPTIPAKEALSLTTLAAVAVSKSIEQITEKKALIKWVNDIYIDNKKVCGILAESSLSSDGQHLDYVILGIGINVTTPIDGFPDDLSDIATAICDDRESELSKELLIATLLNNFMEGYKNISSKNYIKEYISKSYVLGKDIYVIKDGNSISATAIEIDDDCRLKVRYKNGNEEYLTYGEISTKIK